MMTVFYRPMRLRRRMRIESGNAPPTWKTFPMHDKGVQGSAKPGRGGRRKRKARASAMQAIRRVNRILWHGGPDLTTAAMWRYMRSSRGRPNMAHPPPGRRERRRRAKLLRRRARRLLAVRREAMTGSWGMLV